MRPTSDRGRAIGSLCLLCLSVTTVLAQPPRPSVIPVPSLERQTLALAPPDRHDSGRATMPSKAPQAGDLLDGFDYEDVAVAAGTPFIPADPIGAVGPTHLVAVGNSIVEWRRRDGTGVSRQSLQDFFGSSTFGFDPKVVYDDHAGRFVLIALERDLDAGESRIRVAVSQSADPEAGWWKLVIDARLDIDNLTVGQITPHWADYPGLGVDERAIFVTANMFTFSSVVGSTAFADARLWIIDKGLGSGGLYDGGPGTVQVYDPSQGSPSELFTLLPATVRGASPTGGAFFFAAAGWSADFGVGNGSAPEFVAIVSVSDPMTTPTFRTQLLNVGNIEYALPELPDAPQPGCLALAGEDPEPAPPIETNDRRALDVIHRDGELWLCAQVLPETGPDAGQATVHWWRLDARVPDTVVLLDQGDVGAEELGPATHTFMPSLAVNAAGDLALGFSAAGPALAVGAYFTGRRASDPASRMDPPSTLAEGQDCYRRSFCSGRNRWGDYSGTCIDPLDDDGFWIFNQFAVARGSGTSCTGGLEFGRWATRWGHYRIDTVRPDLEIVEFDAPACIGAGEDLRDELRLVVVNSGLVETGASVDVELLLSTDRFYDATDLVLSVAPVAVPPLAAATSSSVTWGSVVVPPGTPEGPYYLLARVDASDAVAEDDENDNVGAVATRSWPTERSCLRGVARGGDTGGGVSLMVLPDGSGPPLTQARVWDGIPGSPPVFVDASVTVAVHDEGGAALPWLDFHWSSTAGGLRFCSDRNANTTPTGSDGVAVIDGPIAGGGHTDVAADERLRLLGPAKEPLPGMVYDPDSLLVLEAGGVLYRLDPSGPVSRAICGPGGSGASALAYDPITERAFLQDGATGLLFDPEDCSNALSIPNGAGYTGVTCADGLLLGIDADLACGPARLEGLDPETGIVTAIGPTERGPIDGLTYDPITGFLYALARCGSTGNGSQILRIDPASGSTTLLGEVGSALGGLALGADGAFYAAGRGPDTGRLFRVDPENVSATNVGPSGIDGDGLALALPSTQGIALRCNSPDIDGDLQVDLIDVATFTGMFVSGDYDYAIDFAYDGRIDLADLGAFALGIGHSCASVAPKATSVAGSLRLRHVTDAGDGTDPIVELELLYERPHRGHDTGPRSLRAWQGSLSASSGLRLEAVELRPGSLEIRADPDWVVGIAPGVPTETGEIVLARLRWRRLDATAAWVRVGAAPEAARLCTLGPEGLRIETAADAEWSEDPATTPAVATALRNRPNPFVSRTVILADIPRPARVEARIYDLAGRRVARIDAGRRPPGRVELVWNGRDRRGRAVGAGHYFYRVFLDSRPWGPAQRMLRMER